MFTGIIEEIGSVQELMVKPNLAVLKVAAPKISRFVKLGDSIAINGVCLTVAEMKSSVLGFDLMKETLIKTDLGQLKAKSSVNLERALRADSRFDGHFVTGHIDLVCKIQKLILGKNYLEMRFKTPKAIQRFLVPKGSVAIDGTSLTIGEVKKSYFSIYLIPYTRQNTILGRKKEGDFVNIEADILAKYILQGSRHSVISLQKLIAER